jgi:hypothetical protein
MNQSHSPQAPLASLNPGNATEANAIAQRAHAEVRERLTQGGRVLALSRRALLVLTPRTPAYS